MSMTGHISKGMSCLERTANMNCLFVWTISCFRAISNKADVRY
uniref:Uncharacterized protein n=1 Tax=Arundo donax TaxID=35708 RepID=A0A0A8YEV2_ARUDO